MSRERDELNALRRLAELEAKARGSAGPAEKYDPTEGMSWYEKLLAGAVGGVVDTARGVGQLTGLVDQQSVDEAKRLNAPLNSTGWGTAGNILGQFAATALPAGALMRTASFAPKIAAAGRGMLMPQTIPTAALAGAVQGAVQPVASNESRTANIVKGAAGGAAVPAAIGAYKTGKALTMPFLQSGREQLAGRVIDRFASNPNALSFSGTGELIPGSVPTLAEVTQDVGLAQLQRALRNNPDANSAITNRMLASQDARIAALRGIAGDQGQREFFDAARSAAAKDLYSKAFSETPTLTPWVKGQITQLQSRPSFREAWPEAVKLAKEEGIKLDLSNTVQVAHYTKMALDDLIAAAAGNKQRALIGTRDKLVSLMESKDFAPSYREARATFSEMSKPINKMDLGQELHDKLVPALSEFGANVRMTPQKYAEAVRNIDQTAKRATGFKGARADKILDPGEMRTVENVARDLARSANAQELGMAKGSPTTQNFVAQDILRQSLGPTGLPRSFADSALAETLLRPISFAYKAPENRLLGLLGDAAIDPALARLLVERARKSAIPYRAEGLLPFAAPAGALTALNLPQQ